MKADSVYWCVGVGHSRLKVKKEVCVWFIFGNLAVETCLFAETQSPLAILILFDFTAPFRYYFQLRSLKICLLFHTSLLKLHSTPTDS